MTQKELEDVINSDAYFQKRKDPTESELRLFLREVNYYCPLCGTELQSRKQRKLNHKRFQIAHIYPNRPTINQYETLYGLERLGNSTEDFENKIALCLTCHSEQDYRTTREDYLKLLNIKKQLLNQEGQHDALYDLFLEKEIARIVQEICSVNFNQLINLNYNPVPVAKKFQKSEALLVAKIQGFINLYYAYIEQCFINHEGKNGFYFNILSSEIKIAFTKLKVQSKNDRMDKSQVFESLVEWIKRKTLSNSADACEAIVAFFIQHCEVFDEIPQ